jgi:hypothetical protein
VLCAVLCLVVCGLLCVTSIAAAADGDFSNVSLKKLDTPTTGDQAAPALMYFEPNDFGDGTATKYPANGSDYTTSTPANASQIGRGPHGGYDTTTSKCGVCHAAHTAQTTTDGAGNSIDRHLTRTGSSGCEYCHLDGSVLGAGSTTGSKAGNAPVYSNRDYSLDDPDSSTLNAGAGGGHAITGTQVNIPASSDPANPGQPLKATLSCASCHVVHGAVAGAWLPTDFWGSDGQYGNGETTDKYGYKLLRANPAGVGDAAATKGPNDATNPVTDPRAVNQYTLSVWCVTCHNKASSTQDTTVTVQYFTQSGNDVHDATQRLSVDETVTGAHDSTMNGVYSGPTQCYSCHRGNLSASPESQGLAADVNLDASVRQKLIDLGYLPGANDAERDDNRICSRCHYGTADYVLDRILNTASDWPHSTDAGTNMLGNFAYESATTTATVQAVPTGDVAQPRKYVCQRCHLADATHPSSMTISYHKPAHTFTFAGSGAEGSLESSYSPGYPTP